MGVKGELISKNSLFPKILECITAFLLTPPIFALPRALYSYGLNILVIWIPIDLEIAWVIMLEGWPNSTCRSFTVSLVRALANSAFLEPVMSLDTSIYDDIIS